MGVSISVLVHLAMKCVLQVIASLNLFYEWVIMPCHHMAAVAINGLISETFIS